MSEGKKFSREDLCDPMGMRESREGRLQHMIRYRTGDVLEGKKKR